MGRSTDDFSNEIQSHIAIETDRLVADGMDPAAARQAAMRAFGNVTRARERFYEKSRWMWLEQFVQDLRYAWRSLRQSPAFLATTVLTLAVGLGVVTVAFTVFNTYVLRPFAVRDPSSLRQVIWRTPDGGSATFRWRDFQDLRTSSLLAPVIAESSRLVSSNGQPFALAMVSDNYFDVLAPRLALGRPLGPADEGVQAAVLSYQGWTRLFARDPGVLGRTLDVNGRRFAIVGVVGYEFAGLADMPRDGWVPFTTYAAVAQPELTGLDQQPSVQITGRVPRSRPIAEAEAALQPFVSEVTAGAPNVRAELRRQDSPQPLTVETAATLAPVFAAFVLVLLTACANVSNVMLARAVARHREIAVRLSLGASRGRVVRQLLTEGALIAVLAGAAGLVLASFALRGAIALFFRTLPPSVGAFLRIGPMALDHRVYIFAFAAAAAATLLFALVPALQASKLPLTDALRGQGGHVPRGSRLRAALVVSQVTVSLVLVVLAITLARNGAALASTDLGYDPRGVMSINIRQEQHQLVAGLADLLTTDPHIAEIAVTGGNPLFIRSRTIGLSASSAAASPSRYTFVSPEYFSILRIPISQGRAFRPDEARDEARVAIVSAATAQALWPGENAIGRTIRLDPIEGTSSESLTGYASVTVVGIVRDVVSGFMADGKDPRHVYLPTSATSAHATALLVRGRTAADLGPDRLQPILARAASDPQVFETIPLDEMKDLQNYPLFAASTVGTILGLVALALSVAGLYGVIAYMLSQRTREIGIRMALGASTRAVVALVMRQSARLAGTGIAIGFTLALSAMLALRSVIRLQSVTIVDAAAFGGAIAVVAAATALAAVIPARRAARVDPALTLRAD